MGIIINALNIGLFMLRVCAVRLVSPSAIQQDGANGFAAGPADISQKRHLNDPPTTTAISASTDLLQSQLPLLHFIPLSHLI